MAAEIRKSPTCGAGGAHDTRVDGDAYVVGNCHGGVQRCVARAYMDDNGIVDPLEIEMIFVLGALHRHAQTVVAHQCLEIRGGIVLFQMRDHDKRTVRSLESAAQHHSRITGGQHGLVDAIVPGVRERYVHKRQCAVRSKLAIFDLRQLRIGRGVCGRLHHRIPGDGCSRLRQSSPSVRSVAFVAPREKKLQAAHACSTTQCGRQNARHH